jgi:N utilization substance protein B
MSNHKSEHNAKRLARLAAVQGLYQMALLPRPAKEIIRDFHDHPAMLLQEALDNELLPVVDQELFASVLTGVTDNAAMLDEMIAGAFDSKISADRVEVLLRAILRGGAFELHQHGTVPAGIIINDYVDVTHAFFNAKEPALVNAVMDKLAKNLRTN